MMTALLATIGKELLLLRRDLHGLLLLFVMPVVFILIMSLALQNTFSSHYSVRIAVLSDDRAGTEASQAVLDTLHRQAGFDWQPAAGLDAAAQQAAVAADDYAFRLVLSESDDGALQADILVAPATSSAMEAVFSAAVREALGRQHLRSLLGGMGLSDDEESVDSLLDRDAVRLQYSYQKAAGQAPTSVQQSVPAWLVFAMFFVVIPLSNALISERQQGTLRRLRTFATSPFLPVIGKLVPYFFITQIQVALMLAVGVWLVPLLGGDRLTLGDSIPGLMLISACLSLAALGYGILIAVAARTTDQATTLGGTGNIILAALGGVMVPRFIMPDTMQQLSQLSPMAWGLEGFLDIFLRNGGIAEVLPEAGALFLFGCVTIALAMGLSLRKYQ